jgi:hypothetical protein
MNNKIKWVDLSILGLCIVALSGLVLRSKIVFPLPFVNYNHLLEAHSHFNFGGWITLALLILLINELLPAPVNRRRTYQWLLGGIAISAWGMLVAYYVGGNSTLATALSTFFIFLTYVVGWIFIRDARKAKLTTPVMLLAISAIVCLILSSSGPFLITYILWTKTFDAILYRDALFTYLHFQYNGFFTLSVFALLFHHFGQHTDTRARKEIYRFAVALCVSVIPSLFLSYLWQDPNPFLRGIAIGGSLLLLVTLFCFVRAAGSLRNCYRRERPEIRFLTLLSLGSFVLKLFLQTFTIFPVIGNAIFGNRPTIMGFLHLVFLGFVSLFILAYFTNKGLLDGTKKFTRAALLVFAVAILLNEGLLITQGLTTMFIPGSMLFPWLLWVAAIFLFLGAILIGVARIRTKQLR